MTQILIENFGSKSLLELVEQTSKIICLKGQRKVLKKFVLEPYL